MCFGIFGTEFKDSISCGGFCVVEANYGQGCGEWSFPIYTNEKGFTIRDNLSLGGFGSTTTMTVPRIGGFSIGDSLILGKIYDSDCMRIKVYGFFGGEFSLLATEKRFFINMPVMVGFQMGGGFELQYTERNSFVVEFGGKSRYVVGKDMDEFKDYNSVNPIIKLGFRSYF